MSRLVKSALGTSHFFYLGGEIDLLTDDITKYVMIASLIVFPNVQKYLS
jgi:hypothetical protein